MHFGVLWGVALEDLDTYFDTFTDPWSKLSQVDVPVLSCCLRFRPEVADELLSLLGGAVVEPLLVKIERICLVVGLHLVRTELIPLEKTKRSKLVRDN